MSCWMVSTQEQERKVGDVRTSEQAIFKPSRWSQRGGQSSKACHSWDILYRQSLGQVLLMHLGIYSEQGTAPALMEHTVTKACSEQVIMGKQER